MELLPGVHTLRLYLSNVMLKEDHSSRIFRDTSPFRPSYAGITTLQLVDRCGLSDVMQQCMSLLFPNLRVLRLEFCSHSVPVVYNFIHRHPTILEATVHFLSFKGKALRIGPLIKLIDGTGTWIAPHGATNAMVDQPSMEEFDEENPVPNDLNDNYGPFYRFSFVRVPVSPGALRWTSWRGSDHPRYRCTGLAVHLAENESHLEDWETVSDFLQEMRSSLPHVEELRLMSPMPYRQGDTFLELIVSTIVP